MVRPTNTEMTVMKAVVYFTTHSSLEAGGTAHHKGQDRETSRSVRRQWEQEKSWESIFIEFHGKEQASQGNQAWHWLV